MNRRMKIGIILGTRPEIIKFSSIIRYCCNNNLDFFILHTNQHYTENLDAVFFRELKLPKPKYDLNIGSGNHGETTGKMMIMIEKILLREKPDIILVQGDTNTTIAGAIAGAKLDVEVGHVEAGLRSYDRTMPEEINRIVADHVSDYLFCPTKKQERILAEEGISKEKIYVTGNTIVDAVYECSRLSDEKSKIFERMRLKENDFILFTAHRPATVDNEHNLRNVIKAITLIASKYDKKIVFPIHPRTKKMIKKFKIKLPNKFIVVDPVGYLDMLKLLKNSFLIITDSGGLQEESCVLKKKCLVVRSNTERPEAVKVGGCIIASNDNYAPIVKKANKSIEKKVKWHNPFGDGKAGKRIMDIIV